MEIITSRSNRHIMELSKLKNKKYREDSGLFFFEGIKLFKEAIRFSAPLCEVIFSEDAAHLSSLLDDSISKTIVSPTVYEKLTDENSPQGVFCVSKHLDNLHKSATIYGEDFNGAALLLEGIRDPGNLGTILRTAYAFGIDRLILSADCADLYNSKTLRAAMGAVFRQPTIRVSDPIATVHALRKSGVPVYAALLNERSLDIRTLSCERPICFAVGNEGHGLSQALAAECTGSVIIPMHSGCESLNVAAAANILMWEIGRGESFR